MKIKKYASQVSLAILAFTALTFFFVAQTANLGGKIRHTEIAGETVNPDDTRSGNDTDGGDE